MVDPMPLRCEIFEMMREYVGANLAKKVINVVDMLKLAAQVEDGHESLHLLMMDPPTSPPAQSCTKLPEASPERSEPRINIKEPLHLCEVRRLFLHLFSESWGAGAAVQRAFFGPLSSGAELGALVPPEFRIAANCCSCLRELTPSFS